MEEIIKEKFLSIWYHKLMFPDKKYDWEKFNYDFEIIDDFFGKGLLKLDDKNLSDEIEQALKRYQDKKIADAYIEGLKDGARWYYV